MAAELGVQLRPSADVPLVASDGKRRRQLSKLQGEAWRPLLWQANAVKVVVKGNCLMVVQTLTNHEGLRSRYSWQVPPKLALKRGPPQEGPPAQPSRAKPTASLRSASLRSYKKTRMLKRRKVGGVFGFLFLAFEHF